jgi:carboxymethylenebutenolidase
MGEIVSYRANGGQSKGYLARPADGDGPAVIVIQEWWGLVGHITALADRFAEAGFVALAPDLYHGEQATEPDDAARLAMAMRLDEAARDIAGAADFLATEPGSRGSGAAAVGFCMGGSLALWSATLSDRIVAAVGFYPGLPWDRVAPDWSRYHGKSALIHCSEGDGTSAAPGIQTAREAIERAGGDCAVYDYPGTDHAFFNDDRPEVYNDGAAATAWARTLEFLRAKLG